MTEPSRPASTVGAQAFVLAIFIALAVFITLCVVYPAVLHVLGYIVGAVILIAGLRWWGNLGAGKKTR